MLPMEKFISVVWDIGIRVWGLLLINGLLTVVTSGVALMGSRFRRGLSCSCSGTDPGGGVVVYREKGHCVFREVFMHICQLLQICRALVG